MIRVLEQCFMAAFFCAAVVCIFLFFLGLIVKFRIWLKGGK